jgi:uncharacterized Zn finger protein (UPF0148 family)
MICNNCNGPLARFEGEHYCPECTRYEVEQLAQQAEDEAHVLHLLEQEQPGPDGEPVEDNEPPY